MLRVLEPFLMLILLMALGGYLYRTKFLDLDFCRRLSSLVVRITLPTLLFVSMYNNIDLPALQQGWIFTAVGLGTSVILAVTAHYSARFFGLQGMTFGTYQILCTNGNNLLACAHYLRPFRHPICGLCRIIRIRCRSLLLDLWGLQLSVRDEIQC